MQFAAQVFCHQGTFKEWKHESHSSPLLSFLHQLSLCWLHVRICTIQLTLHILLSWCTQFRDLDFKNNCESQLGKFSVWSRSTVNYGHVTATWFWDHMTSPSRWWWSIVVAYAPVAETLLFFMQTVEFHLCKIVAQLLGHRTENSLKCFIPTPFLLSGDKVRWPLCEYCWPVHLQQVNSIKQLKQ